MIEASPHLHFISAGRERKEENSGGWTEVVKWVGKLAGAGLGRLLGGLIDGDTEPGFGAVTNVVKLPRYSIENYLFDPIVVYCFLHKHGQAPLIDGLDLSFDAVNVLRVAPPEQLQRLTLNTSGDTSAGVTAYISGVGYISASGGATLTFTKQSLRSELLRCRRPDCVTLAAIRSGSLSTMTTSCDVPSVSADLLSSH